MFFKLLTLKDIPENGGRFYVSTNFGTLSSLLAGWLMLARGRAARKRLSKALAAALAALVGLWGTAAVRIAWFERDSLAVVLADEAPALEEPLGTAERAFTVHEGAEGTMGDERGGFVLFTLPSGLSGWVEMSKLGKV